MGIGQAATTLTFQLFGEDKGAAKALAKIAEDARDTAESLEDMGDKGGKSLAQMGDDADSAGGKLGNLGGKADDSSGRLGVLGKAGKAAGGALAVGLTAGAAAAGVATVALIDASKAAMADQASSARLAQQLEKTTGATTEQQAAAEKWVATQRNNLGFTDDQIRPALQRLAASTKDVGEAQELTTVAMDIAAATGKELEEVGEALAAAHDGEVGSLQELGVSLDATVLSTNDVEGAMSAVAQQFGGAAKTQAETLTGRFGRLKLMFDETKETIGYKVLPVIEQLVTWFQDKLLPIISQYVQALLPKIQEAFKKVGAAIEENKPGLERLGAAFVLVGGILIEKVIPILIRLWSEELKAVITVVGKLGEALPGLASGFLRFAADAVGALNSVHQVALTAFGGILNAADKGMGWIPGIGDKIRSANANFADFRDKSTAKLADVEAGLRSAADRVDDWNAKAKKADAARIRADITDLESKIIDAKDRLKDKTLTDPERTQIRAEIDDLRDKVTSAKRTLAEVRDKTVTVRVDLQANQIRFRAIDPGSGMGGPFADARVGGGMGGALAATGGAGHLGAPFGAWGPQWSLNSAGGLGQHDGIDIITGMGTPVRATRDGWATPMAGGWAGISVMLQGRDGVMDRLAHLSGVARTGAVRRGDIVGYVGTTGNAGSAAHLHIQTSVDGRIVDPIRYLARGGIIPATPGGSLVVAGEGGRDEAVVPLPLGWRNGAGTIGGTVIQINVSGGLGDRQAVARDVRAALLELQRSNGGIALGLG